MREITDLTVTQYRIFPIDAIPFSALKVESTMKAIRETFAFVTAKEGLGFRSSAERIDIGGALPLVSFTDGEYKVQRRKVVIESLNIDARRIVLNVKGSSEEAHKVYNQFKKVLAKESTTQQLKKEPLILFEETRCIVTLDIPFTQFFAPSLLDFLTEDVQLKAKSDVAVATVAIKNFSAVLEYRVTDENVLAQDITLVPKQLVIEPRLATDPKERRYFTSSPFDSDTHFEVLRRLGERFKK